MIIKIDLSLGEYERLIKFLSFVYNNLLYWTVSTTAELVARYRDDAVFRVARIREIKKKPEYADLHTVTIEVLETWQIDGTNGTLRSWGDYRHISDIPTERGALFGRSVLSDLRERPLPAHAEKFNDGFLFRTPLDFLNRLFRETGGPFSKPFQASAPETAPPAAE